MYRDDLEAALARNATLERRVAELERAHSAPPRPTSRGAAAPKPAITKPRPAPPRAHREIVYVPPATWLPLRHRLRHSYTGTWRSLRSKLPSWNVPRWSSSIVAVDLLARPAAWLAAISWAVMTTVWFVLGLLWLIPALVVPTAGFVLGSIGAVPLIALASVRRHDGKTAPRGVQWGIAAPPSSDPDELLLGSLLGLSVLHLPLTLWLIGG